MRNSVSLRRSAAFTLIEILTTLGVIGALFGVMVWGGYKVIRLAAVRGVTAQIEHVTNTHTMFVSEKGQLSANSGWDSTGTMTGTNYSTSDATQAGLYRDLRMVYVALNVMRFDDIMFRLPGALAGGIEAYGPVFSDFGIVAGQVQSTDGTSWSRNPDTAVSGAQYAPTLTDFEAQGKPYIAVQYATAGTLRPAQNGTARTGPCIHFAIWVGPRTYQYLYDELESRIGRTKGYNIVTTQITANLYRLDVYSPQLGI